MLVISGEGHSYGNAWGWGVGGEGTGEKMLTGASFLEPRATLTHPNQPNSRNRGALLGRDSRRVCVVIPCKKRGNVGKNGLSSPKRVVFKWEDALDGIKEPGLDRIHLKGAHLQAVCVCFERVRV